MFGKHSRLKAAWLVAAVIATACADRNQEPDDSTVHFKFNVITGPESARSQITASDSEIHSAELFIFDVHSGGLARRVSFSEDEEYTVNALVKDREYIVYALANCTAEDSPAHIKDMEDVLIETGSLSGISRNGLPMAGTSEPFILGSGSTYVSIPLERLVAKILLNVDQAGLKGSFTIREVSLRNVPQAIAPFAEGSYPETDDGDYATATDLNRLNGGSDIALITTENLQGTLLEGNTDPWRKTPENLPEEYQDVCTFLTVRGDYSNGGLSISDLCYNMYLGEDCTANFDIRRNSIYHLTLSLSDESAALASSWKVERGATEDSRELTLDKTRDTILQYGSTSIKVTCSPGPFDFDIIEGEGFNETALTYRLGDDNRIYLTSGTIKKQSVTGRLWVRSWDRRKSAFCDLTVEKMDPSLMVPVKLLLAPKDTTIHVGDTLYMRGAVIYNSGDTIYDNNLIDWGYPIGTTVLRKPGRSNYYIGNEVGTAYTLCLLKAKPMIDSSRVTVIE